MDRQLRPGRGFVFVKPDERDKIRASGLVVPTIAQDDAFHGEVIAVGAPAWVVRATDGGRQYAREVGPKVQILGSHMPVAVGDVVVYAPEAVEVFALGFSADSEVVYAVHVRDCHAALVAEED